MFLSLSVSVFSEVAPSDSSEQASQSVPMVSTSTPGLPVPGAAATGEERGDGLLEPDADRLELLLCRYLILMFVFFRSNLCVFLIALLQVLCWSVTGPSGLSGFWRRAKPAIWQAQHALHQPGAFLQLCRYVFRAYTTSDALFSYSISSRQLWYPHPLFYFILFI